VHLGNFHGKGSRWVVTPEIGLLYHLNISMYPTFIIVEGSLKEILRSWLLVQFHALQLIFFQIVEFGMSCIMMAA